MRRFVEVAAAICVLLALATTNAGAQPMDTVGMSAAAQPRPAPALNETQRQEVWQAVMAQATDAKLPEGFQPVVGANVPTQEKLPLHPLPGPLANQIPVLKQYYYAKLTDKILLIDPIGRKVVEVIAQ